MPRPKKSEEKIEGEVVKRVSRPRAPRVPVSDNLPTKRPARVKRATVEEPVVSPVRKAPTPIAAETRQRKRSSKAILGAMVLCFVMFGAGVSIGFSDKGAIDVIAIVNERNQKVQRGEVRDAATGDTVTQTIPVQNIDQRPNGGLQPIIEADKPEVVDLPISDSASSTASTSEAITDEGVEISSDEIVTEESVATTTETNL